MRRHRIGYINMEFTPEDLHAVRLAAAAADKTMTAFARDLVREAAGLPPHERKPYPPASRTPARAGSHKPGGSPG